MSSVGLLRVTVTVFHCLSGSETDTWTVPWEARAYNFSKTLEFAFDGKQCYVALYALLYQSDGSF